MSRRSILSETSRAAICFKGVVDVVVCDGFVGNIVLKFTEGLAEGLFQTILAELEGCRPGAARTVQAGDEEDLSEARLAGIRRRAAAGRGRLLPDLPRPIREPGDQNAIRVGKQLVTSGVNQKIVEGNRRQHSAAASE